MSKINLSLKPQVDQAAVSRVKKTLSELDSDDEITITFESADAHQADPVIDLLNGKGFEHRAKGSHDGRNYYITAWKKE